MTRHHLKTWPVYFREVKARTKTFEARMDDRNFQVGDWLHLAEWDPATQTYSGEFILVEVTYIMRDPQFVAPGYAIMGFVILAEGVAA